MQIISPHQDTPDRLFERAERRLAAQERLRTQRHRRTNARLANELMPMAVWYGPRPLLAVTLAELLGRRAA